MITTGSDGGALLEAPCGKRVEDIGAPCGRRPNSKISMKKPADRFTARGLRTQFFR
jgi:hypothetical protein